MFFPISSHREDATVQMNNALNRLKHYLPPAMTVDRYERLRSCSGALVGVLVTGVLSYLMLGFGDSTNPALPFLIAPMGASAVLLFAAPASPMAQPWPVFGGNIISAAVGVTCAKLIGDPPVAAAVSVAAAIGVMFLLRCLHPPGGAAALTAALASSSIQEQGYYFVLSPVALNTFLIVVVAILYNKALKRNYPHVAPTSEQRPRHNTSDPLPTERVDFNAEDLDAALREFNQVLDISRDDLETLFTHAKMHAYRRRTGDVNCSNIMSRDLVTVEYGTALEEAWMLLRKHRIKALPVIDPARRVIGIVTQSDFMRNADLDVYDTFGAKVKASIRQTLHTHSSKPEVVGQIMSSPAKTVNIHTHIVELVPMLSDAGFHHVPVVDDERRLVGIVTQSDLVGALYRGAGKELV